jgi:hypothetical protein
MSKNAPAPIFPGFTSPDTDFGAVVDGRRAPVLVYEIDLSTARTYTGTGVNAALQIKITGNSMFIDQASDVGNATMIFEGVQDNTAPLVRAAVFVQPGFVASVPFVNLWIANTAQAGKKLRIFYGVDIDFVPSVNASVAVSGSVNAVNYGQAYGASYKSITTLAANTPDTIFLPAANVNGAILWSAASYSRAAVAIQTAFLAKTSAPASVIDGDSLAQMTLGENGTDVWTNLALPNPIVVPAGKGLYFISAAAEAVAHRMALYTLL